MVSQPPLHSGLRKTSQTIQTWQLFAKRHDKLPLPLGRIETVKLAKRVGKRCGLRPSTMHVFEFICMITRETDWQGDARPLCNATLKTIAREKNLAYRTVQYAIRELVEAGWIVERLTRNSHRRTFYNRGRNAPPTDAYGVDPSIFAFRAHEFRAMAEEAEHEAEECDKLRRQTVHLIWNIRRLLEDALGVLSDPEHDQFEQRFLDLPTRSTSQEKIRTTHTGLQMLESDILEALASARNTYSHACKPDGLQQCVRAQDASSACTIQTSSNTNSVTKPTEKGLPSSSNAQAFHPEPKVGKENEAQVPAHLLEACPLFGEELTIQMTARGAYPTTGNVQEAANLLRSYIGISPSLWREIINTGAPALHMLACTFELHKRGHVANPGGFMRGLLRNFLHDRLRLDDLQRRCQSLARRHTRQRH